METTLTRESVPIHLRGLLPVTCLFKFTSTDVPTSDSKSKPSPTANTRSPSATSITFALSLVSLPSRTSRRRWKSASGSQSSSFSRPPPRVLIDALPTGLCISSLLPIASPLVKPTLINALIPQSTVATAPLQSVLPTCLKAQPQPLLASPRPLLLPYLESGRGVAPKGARQRRRISMLHPRTVRLSCTDWPLMVVAFFHRLSEAHSASMYHVYMYSLALLPHSAVLGVTRFFFPSASDGLVYNNNTTVLFMLDRP